MPMPMREDPGLFAVATQSPSVREVVAPPPPAMSKMEEVGARSRPMAGGGRALRRSPRLIRKKELSECASDQDLILKLKEEIKALRALKMERLAREGRLDEYMEAYHKFKAASEVPPPAGPGEDGKAGKDGEASEVVPPPARARKDGKASEVVPPPARAGKDGKASEVVPPPAPAAGAAGKKKRKVVKSIVPEEIIEWYIRTQHTNPFQGICDDLQLGKRSKWFREMYAERVAILKKDLEYEQALIKQFRTKGYAEDYTEVTDSSDGDDN